MMDPGALVALHRGGADLAELAAEVCGEGGVDPGGVYEIALAGNATMTHLALGIDPEPLGVAPFVMSPRGPPTILAADLGLPCTRGPAPTSSRRSAPTSAATSSRACSPPGWTATGGSGCSSTSARTARSCSATATALLATAAPAGPAFEGAAIRCGMRAADGAIEVVKISDDGRALQVIGDVGPGGLCGSGLVDAVAAMVAVGLLDASGRFVPDGAAGESRPGWPRGSPGSARSGCSSCTGPATRTRRSPSASTCPSATSASCSSPRRRSPPAGSCCSRSSALERRGRRSRCCSPGRSAATSPRPAPCGSGWSRRAACCASCPPATWRARARRWRCCRCASGPAPGRCWRRCATSSSPTAPTSTTASSSSSRSQPRRPASCGHRLRGDRPPVAAVAARRGWPVDVHPLPPLLHNRPERIAAP